MSRHEKLSCSSSHRWMKCPGSIDLLSGIAKSPDNEHSILGTQAHALAETCLKTWGNASNFLGRTVQYERDGKINEFIVDHEMAEAVQVYVDDIRSIMPAIDTPMFKMTIEEKFKLDWLFPNSGGSSDCNIWDMEAKTLYVHDYKNGEGVVVEPENNPQLMMYGLGALYELWIKNTEKTRKALPPFVMIEKVVLTIVQPRAAHENGPVRRWTIDTKALLFWALNVLKPAAEATIKSELNTPKLVSGAHCRWCDAIPICPEQRERALAVAQTDFDTLRFPDPHSMTPNDILKVLEAAKAIGGWAKEVEAYAFNQMYNGVQYPGFKLVKRKSNRKWGDEGYAESVLYPILAEGLYKPKELLSVAQVEKLLKKSNIKMKLDTLYIKPDTGLSMAGIADKRHAVAPPAVADFDAIEDVIKEAEELDFLS